MKTVIHLQTRDCKEKAIKAFGSCFNPVLKEKGSKTIEKAYITFGSETCIKFNFYPHTNDVFITYASRTFYKKENYDIVGIDYLIRI